MVKVCKPPIKSLIPVPDFINTNSNITYEIKDCGCSSKYEEMFCTNKILELCENSICINCFGPYSSKIITCNICYRIICNTCIYLREACVKTEDEYTCIQCARQ